MVLHLDFLFCFMEELGVLDETDELNLFELHFVFIPWINNLFSSWTESYNRHPLGTEHNSTPRQLWRNKFPPHWMVRVISLCQELM